MNRTLERFAAKLMTRINVDADHRAPIEAVLHDHLQQLVAAGRGRGLTESDAAIEAIRHFEDIPLLARLYNLPGGHCWRIVQRSIPMALIALLFFLGHKNPAVFLSMWLGLTAIGAYPILRVKVGIDQGLVLTPLLRPTLRVEWRRLKRVGLQRRHLFGSRRIVIEYEGDKITMPSAARGMRAAALALMTERPEVVAPEALNFLLRFHSPLVREPLTRRILASALWLFVLIPYVSVLHILWDGIGYSDEGIGLLPAMLLVPYQTRRLPDRPRAAVLNLLITILFLSALTVLGCSVLGNVFAVREAVIVSLACIGLGFIFTWWRADRLALTGTLILTAGLLAGFRTQARPDYLANQITFGTIHAPGSTFAWLDGGKSAAWIDAKLPPERGRKDFTDYALVIGQPGVESRRIPLPIGNHRLIPTRPGTRLTLLTLPENMQDQTSTLHIVQADDQVDSITLPFIVPPIYNDDSPWSPDGKYLYAAPRGASGYLFDATTGQTTMLKQKQPGMYIRWLDANRFKTCSCSNSTTETASIKIYETDARSGTSHLVRLLPLKKDETPTVLAGLRYALVGSELLDMETGRRFVLPMAEPLAAGEFSWQPRTERICYLANAAGQDSYRKPLFESIVVFHPHHGIVAQLDFKTPQRIRWLRLAPDGQRLLFSHSARVPGVKPFMALTHTELWDMASDRRTRLFTHGMIPAILMDVLLMDQNVAEAPCWSPSGDGVVYPTMETIQFARKKMDVSFILARPE